MGVDISKESQSDINLEKIKLKELGPNSISKFLQYFLKSAKGIHISRSSFTSLLGIGKREIDILFENFDMNKSGEIDDYEVKCAIRMILESPIDMKSEFIFKLYDFDSDKYLNKDEIINFI